MASSLLYAHVLPEGSIRLLRFGDRPDRDLETQPLQFDLLTIPLDQAPPYHALSYRWDDPDPQAPNTKVKCNDIEVHIGRSLHLALLQVFMVHDRLDYLWVDFLCINQSNHNEKQAQMLIMPQIYPKAYTVIIWIGPADESEGSDQAMEVLPNLITLLDFVDEPYYRTTKIPLSEHEVQVRDYILRNWNNERDPRTIFVWKLFNRSWFSRTWTLQEAALASDNSIVMCGTKMMRYSLLRHFADRAMSDTVGHWLAALSSIRSQNYGTDPENPPLPPHMHLAAASRMRRALEGDSRLALRESSIIRLLNSLRPLDCTDPRDRIFSVSAFLPKQLTDDLRARGPLSTEELYTIFAEIELGSNKNLLCLAAAGLCQQRHSYPQRYAAEPTHPILQLPTWVPDWTYRKINDPLFVLDLDLIEHRGHHLFQAATKFSPDVQIVTGATGSKILSVKGYILDTICEVSKPFRVHLIPSGTNPEKQPERILDMLLDYKTQIDEFVSLARQYFQAPDGSSSAHQLTLIRQTLIGSLLPAAPGVQNSHGLLVRTQLEQIDPIFEDIDDSIEEVRQICRRILDPNGTTDEQQVTVEEAEIAASRKAKRKTRSNIITAVSAMCKGRRLFVTVNGGMGIGPDIAQENDKICVFHGSCTPSVIRPVTDHNLDGGEVYYKLVGECYMHGVMDGEAMEMKECTSEHVHLI